ncbi:MAG: hypothetical protein ABRQ39_14695 [Candidatus Eremiobacterota bacterium]
MKKYNDDTHWENTTHISRVKEGITGLSKALEHIVKEEPERFLTLSNRFDEYISSRYLIAIISGISEAEVPPATVYNIYKLFSKKRPDDILIQNAICDSLETQVWYEINSNTIDKLKDRLDKEKLQLLNTIIGTKLSIKILKKKLSTLNFCTEEIKTILDCTDKYLRDDLPEDILQLIRKFALTSKNPENEAWQEKDPSGIPSYGGNVHWNGINTVRGKAVKFYIKFMLVKSYPDIDSLILFLENVAEDKSSAVRSCMIECLPYLFQSVGNRIIDIFRTTVKGRPELIETRVTGTFISYAIINKYTTEMLGYIELLMSSNKPFARETCGKLATFALFTLPDEAKDLYETCINGDIELRRGVARTLACNAAQGNVKIQCLNELERLYNDSDKEVRRNVGEVFRYLPHPDSVIENFINKFLTSQALFDSLPDFMNYTANIQSSHQELSLHIAGEILQAYERENMKIDEIENYLVNLAIFIYVNSLDDNLKTRAFDVFEKILKCGSKYAENELLNFDR